MRADLGGPGLSCSSLRVRRLAAGELKGALREEAARHVAECARCQETVLEIEAEKAELQRAVPFEAFAAGVAEKLARPAAPSRLPWGRLVSRWAPLAAAAGVALVAGASLVRGPGTEKNAAGGVLVPGVRSKGAASAELFVQDAAGVHAITGGSVTASARLLVSLHPSGRTYAAVVLLEPGESSVIYSGAALSGPLPQAFEWTGSGDATVVIVLADEPVDAARIHALADVPRGADVVRIPLRR